MTRASLVQRSDEREANREAAARASSASMPPTPIARARPGERPDTLPSRARVQPALRLSSPCDAAEREAERVAEAVMAMPDPPPSVARRPAPAIQRSSLIAARAPMRPAEGATNDAVETRIRRSASGGTLLPRQARRFLEPRYRADFGRVRIHTDADAANLATRIGARAFTFGRHIFFNEGQYRPATREGMELLAHELTHTIQQGETVQRQAAHAAEPPRATERSAPQLQRSVAGDALDWIAGRAHHIPGFRLFTVVIGLNPINMSRVERSGVNILRALVEFIPGGGLLVEALDRYAVFDRAGSWIEAQFRTLGMVGGRFRDALMAFIDSLGWRDIFRLGSLWARARRIFTEPVDRLIDFGRGLVAGVLRFIREAILRPLAALAARTRGYPLLKAVLGQDPVTGEPVARTADALIGGFMTLIGQQEIWENIRRANAIPRAWSWFQTALSGLVGLVRSIPGRFIDTLRSLEIMDLVLPTRAFARVGGAFAGFIGDFIGWAGDTVLSLLEIIFAVVAPRAVPYLRRAGGAFRTILRDPVHFIGNLVRAGIQGFRQFGANFLTHLRTALIQWLTGAMAGTNIYIPTAFSLVEILKFTLSALGLTWASLRAKLVRATNETVVRAMETGFDLVRTLVTRGPAAAWQQIVRGLGNLREMVIEQLMIHVRSRIVRVAIETLVTSLNPVGGFIRAVVAIYDTIRFFIDRLSQIGQVAASFIDSIAAIAAGTIGPAANRVERTMAGLLVMVIGFLAHLIRLGDVSPVVIRFLDQVRAPIDRGLDRVVTWVVEHARRAGRFVVQTGSAIVRALVDWLSIRMSFQTRDGGVHNLSTELADSRPVLFISSRKRTFADYLASLTFPASEREKNGAKQNAVRTFGRITTKLGRLRTRETAIGNNPTPSQRGELRTMGNELRAEYLLLTPDLRTMGVEEARADTVITRITPAAGSRLTTIEAKPLTALGERGNPIASGVRGVPGWDFLDQIDDCRGNDRTIYSEWVRWHLIHSGLHGPAAVFNLVTAPQVENTRHGRRVEADILRRIVEPGTALYYSATIVYGNSTPPLNDFPTSISYVWGRMTRGPSGSYVEADQLGVATYSGFTAPGLAGTATGPQRIILKSLGRPAMIRRVGLPVRVARRVAIAVANNSGLGVFDAMNSYYPTGLDEGRPINHFLSSDKDQIAARVRALAPIIVELG